jgi:hypothetical protein
MSGFVRFTYLTRAGPIPLESPEELDACVKGIGAVGMLTSDVLF